MQHKFSTLLLCLIAGTHAYAGNDKAASAKPEQPAVEVPNIPAELMLPLRASTKPAAPVDGVAAEASAEAACPVDQDCKVDAETANAPPIAGKGKTKKKDAKKDDKKDVVVVPSEPQAVVGLPARRALEQSRGWAENPRAWSSLNETGSVEFTFGASAPTIICSPLRVCDLALEAGETIQGAPHIGDSVRWKIAPATSGGGRDGRDRTTHIIIKPTEAGLDTNMILPTDRRTYHLRLVSSRERYMSQVSFLYPENADKAWQAIGVGKAADAAGTGGDMPAVAADRLYFDYKIDAVRGKPAFKPKRVMDDGYHTYLVMNDDLQLAQAPVLVAVDPAGKEQMVNYRLKGNMFIVDGMVGKVALLSGTGSDQQRVEITRTPPCKRQGWLGVCWDSKDENNG
ncbi:P-type conjugative transfer protein TrbG [Chitinimonas arctica]|uniref:P-type conjugative transfer protein TrbG n=1 Tax=Chitinimonas arctica TaxID=2594795 RepID=A0A516SHE4_9NEIS|nr:P-type conjugative transfer protein TrbG [Chitinimonas arctica]QDQ27583.1 P-type conjugative transfer protein TrbG [Chitinimonas arctica]